MGESLIQYRGDTEANWAIADPVIAEREMVIETDTDRFKIGNGVDTYTELPYGGLKGEDGIDGATGPEGPVIGDIDGGTAATIYSLDDEELDGGSA